jgi:hypothetical protein
VFPEACAFELSDLGPQCEPLWRYSEDQPRDPNGEFASGGGGGDTGRWSVSDEHAEFNETNKSRLESGEYKIMKVPASKVSVDSTYPDGVSLYAEQMKGGEKFPMPVGRSNDGGKTFWSPNGNHRIAAAKSLGDEHIYLMVKKSDLSDRSSRFSERYSPDQSRDPDGKFASGSGVTADSKMHEHVKSWVESSEYYASKMDVDIRAGNQNDFVDAIRAGHVNDTLHRGLFTDGSNGEKSDPANWVKGNEVQLMPSSFSTKESTAHEFSTGERQGLPTDAEGYHQIMIHIEGGTTGLRVDEHMTSQDYKDLNMPQQQEVIVMGKYQVQSVSYSRPRIGNSRIDIRLKQTGTI